MKVVLSPNSFTTTALLLLQIGTHNEKVSAFTTVAKTRNSGPKNSFRSLGLQRLHYTQQLSASSGEHNVQRPANEFSRTYRTDKILGGGPRQRDYGVSIEAEESERDLLAQRFELSNIDKLEAEVSLRREPQDVSSGSTQAVGVEVEGTVRARVTQTCVRTSEDFDVDLEFPIFAIVRPIVSTQEDDDDIDLQALKDVAAMSDRRGNKSKKKRSVRSTSGQNINEMDMLELQKLLQDFDVEDDVIEDEAIYSARDGKFDVGELVSQLFWLKLDPYPKKPGTGPIFTSISG